MSDFFKTPPKKDRTNKVIDGVCAGIAKAVDIDPFWVRLGTVLLTIISGGVVIIFYIVLMIMMESE